MARPARRVRRTDARAELVSSATHLVLTRGYANTSIDNINERAGFSKGTFYHYFKTKSDLLDAIVEDLTRKGATNTQRAIEETEGGALERLARFLDAARRWRLVALPGEAEIMRAVFRPENSLLRERMRNQSVELAAPALIALIEDGMAEGVFRVNDPAAAARVFLILAYGVSDDMVCEAMSSTASDSRLLTAIVQRGRVFMRAIEAILGVSPETLGGPDEQLLADMLKAFRTESQELEGA